MRSRASNPCRFLFCALLGCSLLALSSGTLAAEKKVEKKPQAAPAAQPAMPSHEQMMAEYAKYATPGPEHEFLKSMAGSWKTVTKTWMGPGEPAVSEGRCKTSVILGGRYITDDYKGMFMDNPFEGFGITGYDLYNKEYVSTWVDSMGTAILVSKGKLDPTGKVLTMHATFDDPLSKEKRSMKEVLRIVDVNTRVFEMYATPEGKEVKEMEITYTRE